VSRYFRGSVAGGALPLERPAVAIAVAAISVVDAAEPPDEAAVEGAKRDLVGGVPLCPVAHSGYREAVDRVASAEPNDAVHFAIVVGALPGSVVVVHVERAEQMSVGDLGRRGDEHAREAFVAAADPHDRCIEGAHVVDVRGTGGGEVALVGEVRPLLVLHAT